MHTNNIDDPSALGSFSRREAPARPSQNADDRISDFAVERVSVLLTGLETGLANCGLDEHEMLVFDFSTISGFQRFLRLVFVGMHNSPEAAEAYQSIFSSWDVELLPYLRSFDSVLAESAAELGRQAAEADGVVTARVPHHLLPWIGDRLEEVVLSGAEKLRCVARPRADRQARRQAAARHCASAYRALVNPSTDYERTGSLIETSLFDSGWSGSEVMNLIVEVAKWVTCDFESEDEPPSFEKVLEMQRCFAGDMCECSTCVRVRIEPAKVPPGAAGIVLSQLELAYAAQAGRSTFEQITQQLGRGWSAEQLVHAIKAYFAEPADSRMAIDQFFGSAFNVFCPSEDFTADGASYASALRGAPWFPDIAGESIDSPCNGARA
jgi:hypothetical protein